jgi:anti-sigma B factor antagonist
VAELPLFLLSVVPDRERVVVVAEGEIDMASAPALGAQLNELWSVGWTEIELDLHGVTFMDSSGIHLLLTASRAAQQSGNRLTIIDGSDAVRRVLSLTGMDEVLRIAA